ncbi:hypothetical protein D3C76_1764020 [compost metagenome]
MAAIDDPLLIQLDKIAPDGGRRSIDSADQLLNGDQIMSFHVFQNLVLASLWLHDVRDITPTEWLI